MNKLSRVELLELVGESEEPPLSKTNPKYSGKNLILDGSIRIEPKGLFYYIIPLKIWAIWGYRWNKHSKKWSDRVELFHCREFELEDEPI